VFFFGFIMSLCRLILDFYLLKSTQWLSSKKDSEFPGDIILGITLFLGGFISPELRLKGYERTDKLEVSLLACFVADRVWSER
jgi:hypothetical protein